MFVKYGNYTHALAEAAITISRQSLTNDAGEQYAIRERWTISGLLANPTGVQATLTTNLGLLEAAYGVDGLDLVLLLPDGTTPSAHSITSSATIGGTRVVGGVQYPQGQGAEYVNFRTFTVTVEGDKTVAAGPTLKSFTESLTFSGGGPKFGFIETLNGPPVKQKLRKATIYKVRQQGKAVGLFGYPSVPLAIWPAAQTKAPVIVRGTPRKRGSSDRIEYPVSWNAEFESATPLIGVPTLWT